MRTREILLAILLPIILLALNILVGKSGTVAAVLGGVAVLILLSWFVYLFVRHGRIRIAFTRDQAVANFHEIYELAAEYGGILKASHVSPLERVIRPDDVPGKLKDLKHSLDYHRLIFIDDPFLQDKWIRQTLGLANNKLKVTVTY